MPMFNHDYRWKNQEQYVTPLSQHHTSSTVRRGTHHSSWLTQKTELAYMMHLQRPLTTLIDRLRRSSLSLMMHSILLWATTIILRIYQTSINTSHNLSIPLHSNASPVMYPLRSALAKNNARFATSSARPNRRKDIFLVMSDRICSGTACDIGVAIKPG